MSDLQAHFAQDAALLIQAAARLGYSVTLGEAWRTPEQALLNSQHGTGIANSLHIYRLAIDLNVFKDGQWIKDGSQFEDLGKWWEGLSSAHRWGQRFAKPDGNHFSISPDGVTA